MHEVSLMAQTLTLALEQAQRQEAQRIHRMTLRIGAESGVEPEALRFAFDVTVQETIAAGATLDIEIVPVSCFCETCQRVFQPQDWFYECPDCQTLSYRVLTGREIELVRLEVS
jgi:hydrogenase nickel incorporation protein HypA/HybF